MADGNSFYSSIQARLEQAARAGLGQANTLLSSAAQTASQKDNGLPGPDKQQDPEEERYLIN